MTLLITKRSLFFLPLMKPDTVGVKRLVIRSIIGWCVGSYWRRMTRPGSLKNYVFFPGRIKRTWIYLCNQKLVNYHSQKFLSVSLLFLPIFLRLQPLPTPALILLNLCVSLAATLVIVLIAVTPGDGKNVCRTAAAFFHYFLLSTFLWMLMEGICVYSRVAEMTTLSLSRGSRLSYIMVSWGESMLSSAFHHQLIALATYALANQSFKRPPFFSNICARQCWHTCASAMSYAFPDLRTMKNRLIVSSCRSFPAEHITHRKRENDSSDNLLLSVYRSKNQSSNGARFESARRRCVESLDKALYSHCPKEKPSH